MHAYGKQESSRRLLDKDALKEPPTVNIALSQIEVGGLDEAVLRMIILSSRVTDNNINRDQLMRATEMLTENKPFRELSQPELSEILHAQTLIVSFEEENSIATLPKLLKTKAKRVEAYGLIRYVNGKDKDAMSPETLAMLKRFETVLDMNEEDLKD